MQRGMVHREGWRSRRDGAQGGMAGKEGRTERVIKDSPYVKIPSKPRYC